MLSAWVPVQWAGGGFAGGKQGTESFAHSLIHFFSDESDLDNYGG